MICGPWGGCTEEKVLARPERYATHKAPSPKKRNNIIIYFALNAFPRTNNVANAFLWDDHWVNKIGGDRQRSADTFTLVPGVHEGFAMKVGRIGMPKFCAIFGRLFQCMSSRNQRTWFRNVSWPASCPILLLLWCCPRKILRLIKIPWQHVHKKWARKRWNKNTETQPYLLGVTWNFGTWLEWRRVFITTPPLIHWQGKFCQINRNY